MKRTIFLIVSVIVFVAFGCKNSDDKKEHQSKPKPQASIEYINEYMTLAVLYQQTAAEVRAMQYQTYNMATIVLDEKLRYGTYSKKPAIVVDIDETVLDNSFYEAQMIIGNFQYPEKWDEWCLLGKAPAIPGAVDFINYAVQQNVDVYYVSNRKAHLKDATVKNLIDIGLKNVTEPFLMFRTAESSKDIRRAEIEVDHTIIMLIGDNMNDFSGAWEKKSIEEKFATTDNERNKFGVTYFVLPNSTYGDWEGAIYKYDFSKDNQQKDRMRKEALRGF